MRIGDGLALEGRKHDDRRWSRSNHPRRLPVAGILAALLVLLAAFAPAAEPQDLDLRILSVSLGSPRPSARPAGRLSFVANLPTQVLPVDYSFEEDGARITVGGTVVFEFPPAGEGTTIRQRSQWEHEYRTRRAPDRAAGRLRLDRAHGSIEVKASGIDFPALRDRGPSGLPIEVRLGETDFTGTVDCTARGRTFRFTGAPPVIVVPPPRPPPPPGPTAPSLRILLTGMFSALHTAEIDVVRDATAYSLLWARHSPPMPPGVGAPDVGPPAVDFATEIVVAVFLGDRPDGATPEFTGVAAEGDGARVAWSEVFLGPHCPVPMWINLPTPHAFAAISRVAGTVSFTKTVVVRDCQ